MAEIAYNAKFWIKDGGGNSWDEVDFVTNIKPPAAEAGDVDTTYLQSPDRYKEFIAGLIEPGECEVTCHYSATSYSRLIALVGDTEDFKITFNSDQQVTFAGFVKKVEPTIGKADELKEIVTSIKVSGVLTVGAASSS